MSAESQMAACLSKRADAQGRMSFRDFMEVALYAPEVGYYTRQRERVGRTPGTDFYTSSSLGAVFGELVLGAVESLLGEPTPGFDWLEIGAEPGAELAARCPAMAERFASTQVWRPGDAARLPSDKCVIFANEWLDALPIHRLRYREGVWRELGAEIVETQPLKLREIELPEPTAAVAAAQHRLPSAMPEGYVFDWPLEAEARLRSLAEQRFSGLLLTFDYGKSWESLLSEHPEGTARAYFQHRQHNDLLAQPGAQDLTAHLAWDPLREILQAQGFETGLQRQESFFMEHAAATLQRLMAADGSGFSPQKQTLLELLHPGNLGARFQTLWGRRTL